MHGVNATTVPVAKTAWNMRDASKARVIFFLAYMEKCAKRK
ncbi:hypothetical protein BRPE64_BCDS04360 [Caballeronia insecticola]|uniref:Uncharacterized protein n=1 Tax=Caballeronia insecticola TaxID=758793 RepID=R4X1L4_9BURK|nr:hypothetical protein BRPE64_BCDS04360 [Caballeronia insecticola]